MMVGLWLCPKQRYSAERLRVVYTDLLQHIGVDNEDLGQRRGITKEDVEYHKKSMRFSFRRSVIPTTSNNDLSTNDTGVDNSSEIFTSRNVTDPLFSEGTNHSNAETRDAPNSENTAHNGYKANQSHSCMISYSDLAAAFRLLAATKSPDKEGDNFGAVATRDDGSVCGIQRARALESRVVELIAAIGDIVNNSDADGRTAKRHGPSSIQTVRSDPVFEYFCEKCILSLLVDIAREVRYGNNTPKFKSNMEKSVHGVVWSGLVKAQAYQTVSLLISNVRSSSMLYYLLSNNYINELIQCMQPIQQWTEPAIAKMLPAYVDLLKNLTLQLADDTNLFSFLILEGSTDDTSPDESTTTIEFPLFSATLETTTSRYAQSDPHIYATCLAIIVNLMQIPHTPLQTWMSHSTTSQRLLADHLCQRLIERYNRITYLTTGPVVDGARHNAIANQLLNLKDHLGMIHEVFWSGVRGLDVRLCESLLQRVVSILLKNISQALPKRPFLIVGLIDADVIPESEALAQVSTVIFTCMFSGLAYIPFQRMLAVALLHPKSCPIWSTLQWVQQVDSPDAYVFMPALSDIVNEEASRETCPNPFREEILKTLRGDYGEWRTAAAACLVQSILSADAMDVDALRMLNVISSSKEESTSLEKAVAYFFTRSHPPSAISAKALECMGHLGLMILYHDLTTVTNDDQEDIRRRLEITLSNSAVWNAMTEARDSFCGQALEYRAVTGVSDLFLDLVESALKSRYKPRYSESGSVIFTCLLNRRGHVDNSVDAEILIRQLRCVSSNDVENTRFYINMSLHFRSLCKVIERLCYSIERDTKTSSSPRKHNERITLDLVDKADDLSRTIGGLSDKPEVGTDLDLSGRMFFRFKSALKGADVSKTAISGNANTGVFRSTASLMLVLDPTDIFVVKPMVHKVEENRGRVLCAISLRSIIAAAADEAWLHVAVRCPDLGFLIKNGNMALKFESAGTCLIVKQYLDRSREVLRQDLLSKVPDLLQAPKMQEHKRVEKAE